MPPSVFSALWAQTPDLEAANELLRARFFLDRAAFLKFCFPDTYYLPWNAYHYWILGYTSQAGEWIPNPTRRKIGWKEGWSFERGIARRTLRHAAAAPRGIAKTTLGKGDIVHDIVYGLEGMVLVLSAGQRLARKITKGIFGMFRAGTPLDKLYGPFGLTGGVEEFSVSVRGQRPITVLARSFGTEVRGENTDSIRPTKIVVDDGEKRLNVNNPEQRQAWWDFLNEDILKAGPKEGGLRVEWRGTVLHPDAVLARLLKHPGWEAQKWKAVVRWPDRMDLWEQCGALWKDLSLGGEDTRRTCALGFYQARKTEMDAGAEVLDEAALPIFKCFEVIWGEGMRSFLKELQNEPVDPSARFFDSSKFQRFQLHHHPIHGPILHRPDGRTVRLSDCTVSMRLDPIPGQNLAILDEGGSAGEGDYAVISVIARDKQGWGYILAIWRRRCRDSDQITALWQLAEKWGARKATIESNGFQRLMGRSFERQKRERREAGLFWQVQTEEDHSSRKKEDRIAELEVPCHNGWLLFNSDISPDCFAEFDEFPTGAHDDVPDSVEGAWRNSGGIMAPQMSSNRLK